MRNSLAAVKAELASLLAPGGTPAVSGVNAVYDHEPHEGQRAKPVAMTLVTAGLDPTAYLVTVRIYVAADGEATIFQDAFDSILEAVDLLMTPYWGPPAWDVSDRRDDINAFVAETTVVVGREDGRLRISEGLT
jgi:hypothetical protein